MSHQKPQAAPTRRNIPQLIAMKGEEKIVALTAYTAPMARLLAPHCDLLLVGDSLGMVVYGLSSTLPVTLEMMIAHGAAVVRGAPEAVTVVDLPFASYQESREQAFRNAARVMQETGCAAVKLEGGTEMSQTVAYLVARGIPVMGHVGLMPQHMHRYGGFKAQGRDPDTRNAILADAKSIAKAGAFALVLEGMMEPLAAEITRTVDVPTIGIGASPHCDGQVLVVDDMLGMFETSPRFVKTYADIKSTITGAAASYAAQVRDGRFPSPEHCYGALRAVKVKKSKR